VRCGQFSIFELKLETCFFCTVQFGLAHWLIPSCFIGNILEAQHMLNKNILEIDGKERRRCDRLFFSAEDKMNGFFIFPGNNQEILDAHVMNISISGLHFTIKRNKMISFRVGDRLILTKLMGKSPLQIVSNIEVEIKWVLDNKSMKNIGCGCEFHNLPDVICSQLSNFIESGWSSSSMAEQ
jgi:hypothetical protein